MNRMLPIVRRLASLARACAVAGLFVGPAHAHDLKVATWNLDWLTLRPAGDPELPADVVPKTASDRAQLRRYADQLDADVIAFEEVDGPAVAADIFSPSRYTIVTTDDPVIQRVGFAIRRGLTFQRNPDLAALDVYPDAHFRLRSGADITLVLPGFRLRLLAVHLKTGCHEKPLTSRSRACSTLVRQMHPLEAWLAQRRSEGGPFILLGDFNRVMDGADPFLAELQRAAPLTRATEGHSTLCWGGNTFIDHIMAGGPARAWMQPGTLAVMTYRETNSELRDHLSDHCAVSVRFRLPD